jgi:hypothetical protein
MERDVEPAQIYGVFCSRYEVMCLMLKYDVVQATVRNAVEDHCINVLIESIDIGVRPIRLHHPGAKSLEV